MEVIAFLIPAALLLGLLGLGAFIWSLKSGQFDDLEGAAHRILFDNDTPEYAGAESRGDQSDLGCDSEAEVTTKGQGAGQ